MEHIAALLLIIGCSDDLSQCKELPAPLPIFETVEECDSERPFALGAVEGLHPHVFARCVTVDPALEEEDAVLTWDVRKDGTLVASLDAPEYQVAQQREDKGKDTTSQQ